MVATILLSTTSFILEPPGKDMASTFGSTVFSFLLRSMQSFAKRPDLCEELRAAGEPLTVEACEPAQGLSHAACSSLQLAVEMPRERELAPEVPHESFFYIEAAIQLH